MLGKYQEHEKGQGQEHEQEGREARPSASQQVCMEGDELVMVSGEKSKNEEEQGGEVQEAGGLEGGEHEDKRPRQQDDEEDKDEERGGEREEDDRQEQQRNEQEQDGAEEEGGDGDGGHGGGKTEECGQGGEGEERDQNHSELQTSIQGAPHDLSAIAMSPIPRLSCPSPGYLQLAMRGNNVEEIQMGSETELEERGGGRRAEEKEEARQVAGGPGGGRHDEQVKMETMRRSLVEMLKDIQEMQDIVNVQQQPTMVVEEVEQREVEQREDKQADDDCRVDT